MLYVNRRGEFNDSMFEELEQFAQYQKKYDNYHYDKELEVNGVVIANLEDIRIVYNIPKQVQLKVRVSELLAKTGLAKFNKTDTVKVIITAREPYKEPKTTINVTHYYEDTEGLVPGIEDTNDVYIQPNKWLYIRGTEI